jgi:hypothetical protein
MSTLIKDPEYYYRYETRLEGTGYIDESGDYRPGYGTNLFIELRKYVVVRETLKGVWIDKPFFGEKFILNSARKRFAYPTKEEAWESFKRRKRRQMAIVMQQLVCAKVALEQEAPHLKGEASVRAYLNPNYWTLLPPKHLSL